MTKTCWETLVAVCEMYVMSHKRPFVSSVSGIRLHIVKDIGRGPRQFCEMSVNSPTG